MSASPAKFLLLCLAPLICCTAACSEYGYRYAPHPQDIASPIFADYRVQGKTIDILVDTDGLRLQSISIAAPDGAIVQPTTIDYPPFKQGLVRGIKDDIYGPALADGPTIAHFPASAIGPGPWNVQLQVNTLPDETIHVGK